MTWITEHPPKPEALANLRADNPPQWQAAVEYAGGDNDFAVWMFVVSAKVHRVMGFLPYDGEDFLWRDHFDDGASPGAAARTYLEECN